jgi:hypothetical protein
MLYQGNNYFNLSWITILASPLDDKRGIERVIDKVKLIVFSHLIFIFTIPTHFIVSYWQLYSLCRNPKQPGKYILFFISYLPSVLFPLYAMIGKFYYLN